MVRVLIDLRRTVFRNQQAHMHPATLVAMVLLAALSSIATLLLGLATYPHPATGTDVLALTSALWIGGRLAQSALSGEPILRPELFTLLPLPRRRLAWSLLVVGVLDPVNLFLGVALAALIPYGVGLGPAATVTAVVAVLVAVMMTSVASTAVAGLLGPGSRRGHDTGTVLTAVLISLLAVAGTLLPAFVSALRHRSAPWLSDLLRVLPPGWGPAAVESAGRADLGRTLLPLFGLVAIGAVTVLVWPAVLGRRSHGRQRSQRGSGAHADRPAMLGSGPTAGVAVKELRLWVRDPIRVTLLVIALVVGTAVCVVPRVTSGTSVLSPFAGAMTAVIAGASACNLYGNDGTSLWLSVLTPGSARPDVRGRQLAWLLAVAPYTVLVTVVLTVVGGQGHFWPWALALLAALLGGGAGLAAIGSLVFVQPLDEAGNPTPAWSLKVHVALAAVVLTALPPALILFAGRGWDAVPVGVVSGVALAWWLGRRAVARLRDHQVSLLATLSG